MEKSNLVKLYENFNKQFNKLESGNEFSHDFYASFLSGDTTLYQKFIRETKKIDEEWIKAVESYIPSLNKIVGNPKSQLKSEEELTIIEKAKKTSSQSIKHLSANTHLIKTVDEKGQVNPKKILNVYLDIDFGTYENRLVMTLINRLFLFVKTRYDIIEQNVASYEKRRFHLKSKFPINDTRVDVELNFTLTDELEETELNIYNRKLLARAEYLYKVVSSLKNSEYMHLMKDQKPIHPPIIKTNIIMKNVDYRNVYLLWLFIDRYNTLAFTVDIEEKNLVFTHDYYNAVNRQVLLIYMSIVANQERNRSIYESIREQKLIKNSVKVVRSHPDDLMLTLEDEVIEDNTLNEYYLEANKRIFKQSLENHALHEKSYETTLKRALKETMNISNALYKSFFELESTDYEIFLALVSGANVVKQIEEAKRRAYIAKLIREVKEVDYNESIDQEIKYLDAIMSYSDLLIENYREKEEILKEDLEKINELQTNKEIAKQQKIIATEILNEAKRLKTEVENHRKLVLEEMRLLEKRLTETLNANISQYKKELSVLQKNTIKAYIEKYKPKKRVTDEQIRKEKSLIDAERTRKERELTAQYELNLNSDREKLTVQHQTLLADKEAFYIDRLKQNQANIQALKDYKHGAKSALKEHELELIKQHQDAINELKAKQSEDLKHQEAIFIQKYHIASPLSDEELIQNKLIVDEQKVKSEEELIIQHENKLIQDHENLLEEYQKQLEKTEIFYKTKLQHNEDNLKALADHKQEVEKALKQYEIELKYEQATQIKALKEKYESDLKEQDGLFKTQYQIFNPMSAKQVEQGKKLIDEEQLKTEYELNQEHQITLVKDREALIQEYEIAVKEKEAYYQARLKENEENLKKLEKHKLESREALAKYERELTKKQQASINVLKAKHYEELKQQLALFRTKYAIKRRVTNDRLRKEILLIDEQKLNKEKDLNKTYDENIMNTSLALLQEHQALLSDREAFYIQRFMENQANIEELNEHQKITLIELRDIEQSLIQRRENTINDIVETQKKELESKENEFKQKYQIKILLTDEELNKQKLAIDEEYQKKRLELVSQHENSIQSKNDSLSKEHQALLQERESYYIGILKNNEDNLKTLVEYKENADAHLRDYHLNLIKEGETTINELILNLENDLDEHEKLFQKIYFIADRLTDEQLQKEIFEINEEQTRKERELSSQYANNLINDSDKLTKQYEKSLSDKETFYIERVKENEANIKALEKHKLDSEANLLKQQQELIRKNKEKLKELDTIHKKEFREKDALLRKQYKIKKRVTNEALQKQIAQLNEQFMKKYNAIEAIYNEALNEEIENIVELHSEDLIKTEALVKEKYEENQVNIKRLSVIKKAFTKAIKDLEALK